MTDQQRQQIQEMRIQGDGYRAISKATHLSRDIVRNYCKKRGYIGHGNALVMNIAEMQTTGGACRECGFILKQPKRGRKRQFCCEEHRRKWWQEHPEAGARNQSALYTKICPTCGRIFTVYGQKERIYCSRECFMVKYNIGLQNGHKEKQPNE